MPTCARARTRARARVRARPNARAGARDHVNASNGLHERLGLPCVVAHKARLATARAQHAGELHSKSAIARGSDGECNAAQERRKGRNISREVAVRIGGRCIAACGARLGRRNVPRSGTRYGACDANVAHKAARAKLGACSVAGGGRSMAAAEQAPSVRKRASTRAAQRRDARFNEHETKATGAECGRDGRVRGAKLKRR